MANLLFLLFLILYKDDLFKHVSRSSSLGFMYVKLILNILYILLFNHFSKASIITLRSYFEKIHVLLTIDYKL